LEFIWLFFVSVIFHEVAHGLAATKFRDPTGALRWSVNLKPKSRTLILVVDFDSDRVDLLGSPVIFGAPNRASKFFESQKFKTRYVDWLPLSGR